MSYLLTILFISPIHSQVVDLFQEPSLESCHKNGQYLTKYDAPAGLPEGQMSYLCTSLPEALPDVH